jgi:hypothetical protein
VFSREVAVRTDSVEVARKPFGTLGTCPGLGSVPIEMKRDYEVHLGRNHDIADLDFNIESLVSKTKVTLSECTP